MGSIEFPPFMPAQSMRLGITLAHDEDKKRIVLTQTKPESPVRDAGVKPGDVLVRINGRACGAVDNDARIALIHDDIYENIRVAHVRWQKLVLEFEREA